MGLPDLDRHFPRYTKFDPHVPVWCVTPNEGRAIHRFFDTNPISPAGRYLAVFRLPFEHRRPKPGEVGQVCVIDLKTGTDKVVAETRGWEPQLGANINWGADDDMLIFNDVDTDTWEAFAWRLNPHTGSRVRLSHTVYHCSADGQSIVGGNAAAMCRTQYGYGAAIPEDRIPRNVGLSESDGFFITDTRSGERRLLASVRTLVERGKVDLGGEAHKFEVYPFHSKFNPQGDRLIVTLRWFPNSNEPKFNQIGTRDLRFAVLTIKPDSTDIHCAVGPEQWIKGGHHINFFPDGRRLSMNLCVDGTAPLWFVQCNLDGSDLRKIREDVVGSGHPTLHPNGRHLLTDTYTNEHTAYRDGTIPLRWLDLRTGSVRNVVRINTAQPCEDGTLRVDPHPAWDRTWRYVTFNGYDKGTRRVYIADMAGLLDG